jgi:hypothetical protein
MSDDKVSNDNHCNVKKSKKTYIKWQNVTWQSVKWQSVKWQSVKWQSVKWQNVKLQNVKWLNVKIKIVRRAKCRITKCWMTILSEGHIEINLWNFFLKCFLLFQIKTGDIKWRGLLKCFLIISQITSTSEPRLGHNAVQF